jgi:hypothetical protein
MRAMWLDLASNTNSASQSQFPYLYNGKMSSHWEVMGGG